MKIIANIDMDFIQKPVVTYGPVKFSVTNSSAGLANCFLMDLFYNSNNF
jgi:hypothetical protein